MLTDLKIRKAKPRDKPYRLADGDNLYVFVATTGVKSWQLRYRLDGRQLTATLGRYPAKTPKEARRLAKTAREGVAEGHQLTDAKRDERAARSTDAKNTFQVIAARWVKHEARRRKWSPDYVDEVKSSIRNHLSKLDRVPVKNITAALTAPVMHAIEDKAPLMLEKVQPRLMAILDYAVELGVITVNPIPRKRRGKKVARSHYPAVTDLRGVGEILRAARAADPCRGIQRAHLLLVHTGLRISEAVGAQWDEFDFDAAIWTVPRSRMKNKDPARGAHVVPLPPVLLAVLREWRVADSETAVFVCPAPRDPKKHVTPEGVEKFYSNALGLAGKHSPHSWRSAFSTISRDAGKDGDVIDGQLDHKIGNKTASAYDRAKRIELRRELMTWYEEQLIAARDAKA